MNVGLITVGYLISYIQPWNDAVGVGWRALVLGVADTTEKLFLYILGYG
jgi:hypothetical protein